MVYLLKFIHLVCTLGLLGSIGYGLILAGQQKVFPVLYFKRISILGLLAAATGTLLVYPRHFTFHTPWIMAAYLFILIFGLGIGILMVFKERFYWLRFTIYLFLFIVLTLVVHDAVTKSTLLF